MFCPLCGSRCFVVSEGGPGWTLHCCLTNSFDVHYKARVMRSGRLLVSLPCGGQSRYTPIHHDFISGLLTRTKLVSVVSKYNSGRKYKKL